MNKNPDLKITDFNSQWTKNNFQRNPDVDSMIYIYNNKTYIYSNAVIHLLASINWFFKPIIITKIIPKKIRDAVYQYVAKRRREIIKNKACPMMTPKMKDMFLS